jgi:hypothetical protein
MFRTTQEIKFKSNLDSIVVPSGTNVIPVKNGDGIGYAVADSRVLEQQNEHDRKYRYLFVSPEFVEEIK